MWLGGRCAVVWGGRRERSMVGGFRSINGCPPFLLQTFLSFFVCLFVWVSKTHPITGLSGWRTPDEPPRTQEPVPDRRIGVLPSLW